MAEVRSGREGRVISGAQSEPGSKLLASLLRSEAAVAVGCREIPSLRAWNQRSVANLTTCIAADLLM